MCFKQKRRKPLFLIKADVRFLSRRLKAFWKMDLSENESECVEILTDKLDNEQFKSLVCWMCNNPKCQIGCKKCSRSFHFNCLKGKHQVHKGNENFICHCCSDEERDESFLWTEHQLSNDALNALLKSVFNETWPKYPELNPMLKLQSASSLIANKVSFETIGEKLNKNQYRSSEEFLNEIRWILKNSILLKVSTKLKNVIRGLYSLIYWYVGDIKLCPFCLEHYFKNKITWLSNPCQKQHTLIWVGWQRKYKYKNKSCKGHNNDRQFWPAKIMRFGSYEEGKKFVMAKFFTDQW